MPSLTHFSVLLIMSEQHFKSTSNDAGDIPEPWCWAKWQENCQHVGNPFASSDSPFKTPREHDAVAAYIKNFLALPEAGLERYNYTALKRSDNDRLGRATLNAFLADLWQHCKIDQKVLEVMEEKEFDPYTVMKRHKALEVRGL